MICDDHSRPEVSPQDQALRELLAIPQLLQQGRIRDAIVAG